jgi:hypothetical protein
MLLNLVRLNQPNVACTIVSKLEIAAACLQAVQS